MSRYRYKILNQEDQSDQYKPNHNLYSSASDYVESKRIIKSGGNMINAVTNSILLHPRCKRGRELITR